MRLISLVLIGVLLVVGALQAEISFQATVDKLNAAYEDKIHLQLEVKVSDPAVKTTPIPPPSILGLQIGGSGSSVERQGDLTVRKYTYELVPARSGSITIPAFRVEFQNGAVVDTLTSESITVDIAQPKPVKAAGSSVLRALGYGLMLIAAALVAILWLKRRKPPVEPSTPDWREEYRQRFADVRKFAERQDFRTFSTEAMRLIVAIIERTFEARLSGFTSADLLRWLSEKNIDKETLALYKDLFDFCEGVKFSTGKVDVQEGMQATNRAEKIVELLLK